MDAGVICFGLLGLGKWLIQGDMKFLIFRVLGAMIVFSCLSQATQEEENNEFLAISERFEIDLMIITTHFIEEGDETANVFRTLISEDPKHSAQVARFWRTKALIHLDSYIENQRNLLFSAGRPTEQQQLKSLRETDFAIRTFYVDNWGGLKKMISNRMSKPTDISHPLPLPDTRSAKFIESLKKFQDSTGENKE